MPYRLDTDLNLAPRIPQKYFVSSVHRRHNPLKSRWTIKVDQEVECFVLSQINEWIDELGAWGLIKSGNSLLTLGENDQDEPLKIAKFVLRNKTNVWHGYPADFKRNQQDRPGMHVLTRWRTDGHIEKHHIIKIRQGKECNL